MQRSASAKFCGHPIRRVKDEPNVAKLATDVHTLVVVMADGDSSCWKELLSLLKGRTMSVLLAVKQKGKCQLYVLYRNDHLGNSLKYTRQGGDR